MAKKIDEPEEDQKNETLESEVKKFVESLPYWAKFLADKKISGATISDEDVNTSYLYLLEELKLAEETEKTKLAVTYNASNIGNHKPDLLLLKLENVEGVNALIGNQKIEFNPNLTIVYGSNGSGKSGYTRLLKKVFYSKSPEDILKNIHNDTGHKPVDAKFTFSSNNTEISLMYNDKDSVEFEQFSVFDGKSVIRHLDQKNEFEFRPAGLGFFAGYTASIIQIEQILNRDISAKKTANSAIDLSELFDGDSEIKDAVKRLSAQTKIEELKKFTPFSDADKEKKQKLQKDYDDLFLISKGKNKEIQSLENIKKLLGENRQSIEKLNRHFTTEYLTKIKESIKDCISKVSTAKAEGIELFNAHKILEIGTEEWRSFIISAEAFARKQKAEDLAYPEIGDNCLLCHQPLSEDSRKLIANYWIYIKSIAEENAKTAQEILDKLKYGFEKFNFDLFLEENILTSWFLEKYPKELEGWMGKLAEQKILCQNIISDVQNKKETNRIFIQVSVTEHSIIENAINASIKLLREDEQNKELEKLHISKVFLEHKEKFNIHLAKFENYLNNEIWIKKAEKANFAKRKITDTEKSLSEKYFNQRYIDIFNEECKSLNGNFGVEISHTGTGGRSYRQLKLKGKNPNTVLSDGEQKIIAIADFLAEMRLSETNRGLIFDDPVTSLDETRKSEIAKRLVQGCSSKQTIIFTHDLVFVSSLIGHCSDSKVNYNCHWIENRNGNSPGQIWLNNAPSYEKEYRNAEPAKKHYGDAKKDDCPPMQREFLLKSGFASLRTSYEVLVINDLFKNVVQRFNERVSIDSLSSVYFDIELINELQDSFAQCCRYMEGHTHSDKYAYKKPEPNNLNEEIQRFEIIKSKIKKAKKLT